MAIRREPGSIAAAAWLVAIAVLAVVRAAGGHPHSRTLALTPAELWDGQVWRLGTSGLLVSKLAALEILGAAATVAVCVAAFGSAAFWAAAALGHVGSTLVAYAVIGVLWVVDRAVVTGVVHDADYGISGVWFGALGLLAAGLLARRPRAGAALLAWLTAVAVGLVVLSDWLTTAEHVLALFFGVATGVVVLRARTGTSKRAS